MRIIELKARNIEMTEAIKGYTEEKVMSLEKLCEKFSPCDVTAEVGKETTHHNKGELYYAVLQLTIPGSTLRSESKKEDLYAAIDDAKDDLKRQIVERKDR